MNISIEYRISFASIYRAIRVRASWRNFKNSDDVPPRPGHQDRGRGGKEGGGSSSPFSSCPLDRVSSIDSTRAPGGTSALIRLLRDQRWRTCEDARLKRGIQVSFATKVAATCQPSDLSLSLSRTCGTSTFGMWQISIIECVDNERKFYFFLIQNYYQIFFLLIIQCIFVVSYKYMSCRASYI